MRHLQREVVMAAVDHLMRGDLRGLVTPLLEL
jgi:hypothetical protein